MLFDELSMQDAGEPVAGLLPVTWSQLDSVHVAVVRGELDLCTEPILRAEVGEHIHTVRRPAAIVLDLGGLRFCDGRGLAVLLALAREAEAVGVGFALASCPAQLSRLIRLTKAHLQLLDTALEAAWGLGTGRAPVAMIPRQQR